MPCGIKLVIHSQNPSSLEVKQLATIPKRKGSFSEHHFSGAMLNFGGIFVYATSFLCNQHVHPMQVPLFRIKKQMFQSSYFKRCSKYALYCRFDDVFGLRSKLSLHQQSHFVCINHLQSSSCWWDPAASQLRFQCIAECLWLQHGAREKDAWISWWVPPEVTNAGRGWGSNMQVPLNISFILVFMGYK